MRRTPSQAPDLKGFTFVKLLGSGGFSDVFLYEQALPKRRVAVKVLLTEDLTEANQAAFVAEANLMAQLSAHPYIVSIYHADVSDDLRPYFIMEYCSGPSMADRYKRQPFTVVEALKTGVRLSSAVATAHAAGILHRDIKPANVLTNDYGWPALTDFGISSAVEEDLPILSAAQGDIESTGTSTGSQAVGMSIPWSPPEMFEDDPKPDVRSDVFSVAATIYTLLAGRTPFEVPGRSNQSLDLMSRIERGAITPMDRDDIPPSLLAVLRKGMAVSREQRFSTALDFARALQRVELELSYSPTTIDIPNMDVQAPETPRDDDHEDATRARSVVSIAQAPAVAPRAPSTITPPPSHVPELDATRARGVPVVQQAGPVTSAPRIVADSSPVTEHTVVRSKPAVEAVSEAPKSKTGLVIGVSAAVLATIAIAAIVVLPPLFAGDSPEPETQAEVPIADSDDGPLVTSSIPSPTAVSTSPNADGTSIVFTWANETGKEGDTFVWQRTDGASDESRVPTTESSVEISGVTPGSTVCIDVWVRRSGDLSPEPLAMCVP